MTIKLGMFTMPFHHPARDYTTILEEDQDAPRTISRIPGHDWDQPKLWRRSMALLARDVMPAFSRHAAAR